MKLDKDVEIDLLKARIIVLEDALFGEAKTKVPYRWGLSGTERDLLMLLMSREFVSYESLLMVLHPDPRRDEPELKTRMVQLSVLKKKLRAAGVVIRVHCVSSRGYHIDAPTRKRFAAGEFMK